MKRLLILMLAVSMVGLLGSVSFATNITIWDGMGGTAEDEEVEPGCVPGQQWDLEGMLLNGSKLTIVGGYNFSAGQDDPYRPGVHYNSGDIFIDTTNDAVFGATNSGTLGNNGIVKKTFGYEYAIRLDFTHLSYTVYSLGPNTTVRVAYFGENYESSPWRYEANGAFLLTGGFSYATGLSNAASGFTGGSHNSITLDLGTFLAPSTDFTAHYTYGCGNDNLMGKGTTVPEPSTLVLLGMGMAGLAAYGWRKRG